MEKSAQDHVETSAPEGLGSEPRWATHLLYDLVQVAFLSGPLFSALRKYWMNYFLGSFGFTRPRIPDEGVLAFGRAGQSEGEMFHCLPAFWNLTLALMSWRYLWYGV